MQIYFFFLLFIAVVGLAFFIFLPFLAALVIAAIFSVLFYPVYQFFCGRMRFPRGLGALATILIIVILVLVPLLVLGFLLFDEARTLYQQIGQSGSSGAIADFIQNIEQQIEELVPVSINLAEIVREGLRNLSQGLGGIFAGTVHAMVALFIWLVSLYYFLKDGERFTRSIIRYSPLDDKYDWDILHKLKRTIDSVIKGSLVIALLQAVATSVGLFLFGVPNPILWGAIAGLGALIPGIGTSIVILPAIMYLFFTQSTVLAIGFAIWGATAVGLIDNLLGPKLIGQGVHIHPLFILLSVLGGLVFFGPAGLFLGPIVLSLLFVLGEIYTSIVRGAPQEEGSKNAML